MFTYVQQVGADKFVFADGSNWQKRGDYGPTYIKQRGFVTGAFTQPVQERLQSAVNSLYDPSVQGLQLVQSVYQSELSRLQEGVLKGDRDILREYTKRVKVGGSSQQAQYLRETYQLTDNYVDILFTKGLKRSNCVIPVEHLNATNFRKIDVSHHALQISSTLMKVVKNTLTDDEKKQAPQKVSAAKQQILDLAEQREDDDVVIRLDKPNGKHRKYEYFTVPYWAYNPTR
jgi:hypothetical protein